MVGGVAKDVGEGRWGGRARNGEKARDDGSGKPGGQSGREKRVCGVQRGRMCLETTVCELPPVGERGGVDLENEKTWLAVGGEGRQGRVSTCLGHEMGFFDWGDKVRDIID